MRQLLMMVMILMVPVVAFAQEESIAQLIENNRVTHASEFYGTDLAGIDSVNLTGHYAGKGITYGKRGIIIVYIPAESGPGVHVPVLVTPETWKRFGAGNLGAVVSITGVHTHVYDPDFGHVLVIAARKVNIAGRIR